MKKIRFLHMADLHIGSSAYIKLNLDAMSILHDAVEYANTNSCNYIFICGDLFDNQPNKVDMKRISTIFSNFNGKVFIIYGNHDFSTTKNIQWSNNIQILGLNGMENFYDAENNVRIWGYSYEDRQISTPLYNEYFNEHQPNTDEINILLAHGGDKLHIPIDLSNLAPKFDYIALGHFHSYTIKENNAIYSGSLIPQDRTETNKHGYIYATLENKNIKHNLIEISTSYKSISYDVTNITNIETLYKNLYTDLDKSLSYNITLTGKRNPTLIIDISHLLNIENIEDVVDNTTLDVDYQELYEANKNNILGVFIENLLSDSNNELAKSALEVGVQAFLEEMNDN